MTTFRPPARALAGRAFSNALLSLLPLGLLMLAWPGCDKSPSALGAGSPETAQIAELIEAYTPLDRTVTSDVKDAKFAHQLKVLDACSKGGKAVGHAALAALREPHEKVVDVERALLTVGARAATDEALPLLENLVTQYGTALDLRTEAALLLAEVAPTRALEILEPMVTKQRQNQTMPPAEFLVKAWVIACEKTGRSPVKELCDVATNLFQEESARVLAVKELGRFKDPRAEAALRTILVESTGDGYLRRKAVQSLHAVLPAETACTLFHEVASKEADMNFLRFLVDVLDEWCP